MDELTVTQVATLDTQVAPALSRALQQAKPMQTAIRAAAEQLDAALAALLPFVPAPVADYYLLHPHGDKLAGLYLNGTVVCVALPGLSALSAQLAREGRRGNEALGDTVQRLFATLLDEVYAHGGGVIKFGDAGFTAFFDAGQLQRNHGALAAQAALQMRARVAQFPAVATQAGSFQLQFSAGVQSGRIFAAEVGDRSHRELIIAGRAISRAVVAQNSTAPGEVIVVGDTRTMLRHAQTHQLHNDLYVLDELPPLDLPPVRVVADTGPPSLASVGALLDRIAAMQPYMPADLSANTLRTSGEFRPVTVVFQDFYALSRLLTFLELPALAEQDPTIVGEVANIFYTQTQSIIHQFGGQISTVDAATFGNRCMAVFGAPVAHEDDPERAVRAALALNASLPDTSRTIDTLLRNWAAQHPDQNLLLRTLNTSLRHRTGIASGVLFAGVIGTAQHHEYSVLGKMVGLAARLMTAADNGAILVSSGVHHAAQRAVPMQPKPTVQVDDSSAVFEISEQHAQTAATARPRGLARLVGRAAELERLLAIADHAFDVSKQAGSVVALVGEPGIGKSRLMDEALQLIEQRHETVTVVSASCQSYEQTTPYAVIAQLMRHIVVPLQGDDKRSQAQYVQQQLDALVPEWSRFAPLLAPLLHVPIAETELTKALTAEQRRERLHDLVVNIFVALAQRAPLLLCVDNFQWSDASSHALLARIAEEVPEQAMLLALLYRPALPFGEPWNELAHTHSLTLQELSLLDSRALVEAMLGGATPAEVQPLIERARGVPFFLEETTTYLLRSGTLRRNDHGTWAFKGRAGSNVPARVEQFLVARLDRLDPDARALTEIAAVIGQHVPAHLLEAAHGTANVETMRSLLDDGVLASNEGVEPSYEFRQALVRDVAYESILFARRRELHERVAAAVERIYGGDLNDQRVIVAQHYFSAELYDRAFPHFLRAAQEAQARYANNEAVALYRQAIQTAPWRNEGNAINKIDIAIELYENLGDVLTLTGDYGKARHTYEWLLGLLQVRNDALYAVSIAALQRKFGSTFEQQGNLDAALQWFVAAAATIERAVPDEAATLEQARLQSDTGWVHFRRNSLDAAQECLEEALSNVDADAHYEEQARILNRLGGVAWSRGNMEQAQAYVERSLAASERSGDLVAQAWALNNLGVLTENLGNIAASLGYCLRALDINERIGSRRMLAVLANNIGYIYYNNADYEQAHLYLGRSYDLSLQLHDSYQQMRALLNLGRLFTSLQQWDNAVSVFQNSYFIAAQLHLPLEQLEIHVSLAELALLKGDLETAVQEFGKGMPLSQETETEEYGRFQRLEARIALAQGNLPRAAQLLTSNIALFSRLHNTPEVQRSQLLLAQSTLIPQQ